MVWVPLTHSRVTYLLKNPLYTGAYVWGRTRFRPTLSSGGGRKRSQRLQAHDQWHTLRFDSHPAYLSWQEYLVNLQRLQDNDVKYHSAHGHGAPRGGEGMLQGLCLCGLCGRRMKTHHRSRNNTVYVCCRRLEGGKKCWTVVAWRIDQKVIELFLSAVAPPELELSLAVLEEVESQAAEVDRQWKLRLERARYEAARAERQYHAVEPENRIVVRTLETRWNQKLQELLQVEREYEQTRRARKLDLSEQDRAAIAALSKDLPQVFHAPTTTTAERKQLLRLLIEDVVLTPVSQPERATQIRILWKTGTVIQISVPRPANSQPDQTQPEVVEQIRELSAKYLSYAQIAQELNQRKLQTGKGHDFTRRAVGVICRRRNLTGSRSRGTGCGPQPTEERDAQGRYSLRGLALRYGVPLHRVRYWMARHVLTAHRDTADGPYWVTLTAEVEERIAQALRNGYSSRH